MNLGVRGRCTLEMLLPGDPATRTGGYRYDARIASGLRALGWTVNVHALDETFPVPTRSALSHAEHVLDGLPDGSLVVIDGLALGGLPGLTAKHAERLRLVGLVHHRLVLETGLDSEQRDRLGRQEQRALGDCCHVLVTSEETRRDLVHTGVAPDRIGVVQPGTDPADASPATPGTGRGTAPELLSVGAVVPRKGQLRLVDALAKLTRLAWRCTLVGSDRRDRDYAARVRAGIDAAGLAGRVRLLGEVDDPTLARLYERSDLFVLASDHEGYGMALAEAIAHGLPVLATRAGAIPETVPPEAGLLVAPDDEPGLVRGLERLLLDRALRVDLADGARRAARSLPTWDQAASRFATELRRVEGL